MSYKGSNLKTFNNMNNQQFFVKTTLDGHDI